MLNLIISMVMSRSSLLFTVFPKYCSQMSYFKDLSSDAKVLYGLMLDRMSLSIKNNWIDEEDRVYIIFTLEQVMQYMNCGKDKGVKILAELDTRKGIGLIERVKRGLGKPPYLCEKFSNQRQTGVHGVC
ncbi:MAG: replication initiator protein A [Coprococcus catus]